MGDHTEQVQGVGVVGVDVQDAEIDRFGLIEPAVAVIVKGQRNVIVHERSPESTFFSMAHKPERRERRKTWSFAGASGLCGDDMMSIHGFRLRGFSLVAA